MKEYKFKPGDRVRVKDLKTLAAELDDSEVSFRVPGMQVVLANEMKQHCGKVATIKDRWRGSDDYPRYHIDLDGCTYSWVHEFFEEAWSLPKVDEQLLQVAAQLFASDLCRFQNPVEAAERSVRDAEALIRTIDAML